MGYGVKPDSKAIKNNTLFKNIKVEWHHAILEHTLKNIFIYCFGFHIGCSTQKYELSVIFSYITNRQHRFSD